MGVGGCSSDHESCAFSVAALVAVRAETVRPRSPRRRAHGNHTSHCQELLRLQHQVRHPRGECKWRVLPGCTSHTAPRLETHVLRYPTGAREAAAVLPRRHAVRCEDERGGHHGGALQVLQVCVRRTRWGIHRTHVAAHVLNVCDPPLTCTSTFNPHQPCEALHTAKTRQLFLSPEPDFYISLVRSHVHHTHK